MSTRCWRNSRLVNTITQPAARCRLFGYELKVLLCDAYTRKSNNPQAMANAGGKITTVSGRRLTTQFIIRYGQSPLVFPTLSNLVFRVLCVLYMYGVQHHHAIIIIACIYRVQWNMLQAIPAQGREDEVEEVPLKVNL